MKKCLSIVFSVIIFLIPMTVMAEGTQINTTPKREYVVQVSNEAAAEIIEDKYDAVLVDENIYCVKLSNNQEKFIERSDDIVNIEENGLFYASTEDETLSDNVVYEQWYLDAIGVESADMSADATQKRIKVELMDSGVDFSEEFNPVNSVTFINGDENKSPVFQDNSGHGTAIASVIAGYQDNDGFEGIDPNCDLYSVKVLNSENIATLTSIISGIYWGIENNVDIINMSFGSKVDSQILHNAIIDAHDAGILIVAAAGNTQHNSLLYPAAYNEVLSVGSVDCTGELSDSTSVGDELDVLAPGEDITAVGFLDEYCSVSGTSFATAQVTAIASLLWSQDTTKSNDFIKELICQTVNIPSTLEAEDYGIINYASALEQYDSFEQNYESGNFNVDLTTSEDFDYSDTEELEFEALWRNKLDENGHYTLSTEAANYANFAGNAPAIAREACTKLDANVKTSYKNISLDNEHKKTVGGPHGAGNYVINLRFLYNAARIIYEDGVGTRYNNLVNSYTNNSSYWNVSWHPENSHFDKDRFTAMTDQVQYFLDYKTLLPESIKNNFSNYSSTTQNRYLGTMIFGMALHLAGDMYAHRSIVPIYTLSSDSTDKFNPSYFPSATGTTADNNRCKDFCYYDGSSDKDSTGTSWNNARNWNSFYYCVNQQVVEFRDINQFLTSSYRGTSNPYEDKASFCDERYNASLLSCKRIAKRFKDAGTFYTKLFYPKCFDGTVSNGQFNTLKLNNFKNYTDASGLARIGVGLSESDWSVNSNYSLV